MTRLQVLALLWAVLNPFTTGYFAYIFIHLINSGKFNMLGMVSFTIYRVATHMMRGDLMGLDDITDTGNTGTTDNTF